MIKRFFNISIILWNCDFNTFNFKNQRILARYKCRTPWWGHINVETGRRIYCIKRDIVVILIVFLLVVIKTTEIKVSVIKPTNVIKCRNG